MLTEVVGGDGAALGLLVREDHVEAGAHEECVQRAQSHGLQLNQLAKLN